MITGATIGAGIGGAIAGVGGVFIMFKFLNAKVDKTNANLDKKQDKDMCLVIARKFEKALDESAENQKTVMTILGTIQVSNEGIRKELKHLNAK